MSTAKIPEKLLCRLEILANGETTTRKYGEYTLFKYGPREFNGRASLPARFLSKYSTHIWEKSAQLGLSDDQLINLIECACDATLNYKELVTAFSPDRKKTTPLKTKLNDSIANAIDEINTLYSHLVEIEGIFQNHRAPDDPIITDELKREMATLEKKLKSLNILERPEDKFVIFATSSQKIDNVKLNYARGLVFLLHERNFPFTSRGMQTLIADVASFAIEEEVDGGISNQEVSNVISQLQDFLEKNDPKS